MLNEDGEIYFAGYCIQTTRKIHSCLNVQTVNAPDGMRSLSGQQLYTQLLLFFLIDFFLNRVVPTWSIELSGASISLSASY